MDDDAQEDVAGVAVAPPVSRRELEDLARGETHEVIFGVVPAHRDRRTGNVIPVELRSDVAVDRVPGGSGLPPRREGQRRPAQENERKPARDDPRRHDSCVTRSIWATATQKPPRLTV